jgi:glyoxylase-like metal-dependent hydrolase (beta-lactamase superfamily II)
VIHTFQGEKWFGLNCVRVLEEPSYNVLLIPLVGHSRGHCGVAIDTGDGWLLHGGDAYVRDMQIDIDNPRDPFPVFIRPLTRQLFPQPALKRLRLLH